MSAAHHTITASLVALAIALAAPAAKAATGPTYGPAGAWVKPQPLPPAPTDLKPDQNTVALLRDIQINAGQVNISDATTTYHEVAVVAGIGYRFDLPMVSWDPAFETVVVHKARIIRGGQIIDLGDKAFAPPPIPVPYLNATFMQHTPTTLRVDATRVQPGDVIDLAWSVVQLDPALGGKTDVVIDEALDQPTSELHVRALWPTGRPVQWKGAAVFTGGSLSTIDGHQEWRLDRKGVPALNYVPAAVQGLHRSRLVFTTFRDWSDLASTLTPAFAAATVLNPDGALKAEVTRIGAVSTDPKHQVIAALRTVQEQMRAVPAEAAPLTALPDDADALWAGHWGDPKSLAIVLTALLRGLDIDASLALTSSSFGHALNRQAPDAHVFDRLLVQVTIGGQTYWLDPTVVSDRDIDHRAPPPGWALPLRAKATLQDLTPSPPTQPTSELSIRIDATAGLDVPAPTHIEQFYRTDTDITRADRLDGLLPAEAETQIRYLLQGEYPAFQMTQATRHYDPQTGELKLSADGVMRLDWQQVAGQAQRQMKADSFDIRGENAVVFGRPPHVIIAPGDAPEATSGAADDFAALTQDIPISVTYPERTSVHETVLLPYGGKDFGLKGDGAVDTTLVGVHYRRTALIKDGVLTVDSTTEATAPEVPRPQGLSDTPKLQQLTQAPIELVAPPAYDQTPADKALADAYRPTTANGFATRGRAYFNGGEISAALADVDAAIALRPDWAPPLIDRGLVRGRLKDLAGAEADFKAAMALDPQNVLAYSGEAGVLGMRKDYDGAIAILSQAIERQPQAADLHLYRGRAHLAQKDYVAARADAETELTISGKTRPTIYLLIGIDTAEGKTADAIARARDLVARYPGDDATHQELGMLLGCLAGGMTSCTPDRPAAFDELSQAIALHPTAYAYASRSETRKLTDTAGRQADLDAALAIDPNDDFALMTRSAFYLYEKDFARGLADAEAVLAHTPADPQALNLRAILLGKLKRYDEQMAVLDAELKVNPENAQVLNSLCWARAVRNVELDKALDNCSAAIKASPLPGYYDSRALVNLRLGKLDDAQADYDTALSKRPDLAGSLYGRGLVKIRKGQVEDGKADIAKALAIDPHIRDDFKDMGLTPDQPAQP